MIAQEFSKAASKGANIVISTPTPEFPEVLNKNCRGYDQQWFNTFSRVDCSIKKPLNYFASEKGEYSYINQSLRKIEGEEKNIFLFDALSLMCPDKVCNYKKKNTLLYFDEDHLSNHAALNIITLEMLYFLNKNNILFRQIF